MEATFEEMIKSQIKTLLDTIRASKQLTMVESKLHAVNLIITFPTENISMSGDAELGKRNDSDFTSTKDNSYLEMQYGRPYAPKHTDRRKHYKLNYERLCSQSLPDRSVIAGDLEDQISIKLFSLSAGNIHRYPASYEYGFGDTNKSKCMKHLKNSLIHMGNKHGSEGRLLDHLNSKIDSKFKLNSNLYFHNGLNATPDAILFDENTTKPAAVAEFKYHHKTIAPKLLQTSTSTAIKQLVTGMLACRVDRGYLVVEANKTKQITLFSTPHPTELNITKQTTFFQGMVSDDLISHQSWEILIEEVEAKLGVSK